MSLDHVFVWTFRDVVLIIFCGCIALVGVAYACASAWEWASKHIRKFWK